MNFNLRKTTWVYLPFEGFVSYPTLAPCPSCSLDHLLSSTLRKLQNYHLPILHILPTLKECPLSTPFLFHLPFSFPPFPQCPPPNPSNPSSPQRNGQIPLRNHHNRPPPPHLPQNPHPNHSPRPPPPIPPPLRTKPGLHGPTRIIPPYALPG